jgi:translation initiation factor 2-alpha kinase 4
VSVAKNVRPDFSLDWHCRLSKDVIESVLSYTRGRDIHSVGVIFMQMVNGRDVMRQFSDPKEAVQAGKSYCISSMHSDGTCSTPSAALSPTLQTCALNMLVHAKKVSCLSLLADRLYPYLSFLRLFPDVRTPNPNGYSGSPEKDYFQVPQRIAPASRWKEDWEELELLVS